MKQRFVFLAVAGVMLLGFNAAAQVTTLDDFEGYADDAGVQGAWAISEISGNETLTLNTSNGAESTNNSMHLTDDGFGFAASTTGSLAVAPPAAGYYKFHFSWRNGADGTGATAGTPMRHVDVRLVQNGSTVADSGDLANSAAPDATTDWTYVEVGPVQLTTDALTITIAASNGAATDYNVDFDQFAIEKVSTPPPILKVNPDPAILISKDTTITAVPSAGSGTYTMVEFDVNNDSTVDYTANAAPYTFNWVTTETVPMGSSQDVDLRVRVTDSLGAFTDVVNTYHVKNEGFGRDSMIQNGDFSQFQGEGSGVSGNLPVGWVDFQQTTHTVYGPAESHDAASSPSLKVTFSQSDFTNRYALHTIPKTGVWLNLQTAYWGKGNSDRLFYATSTDGGATFVVATGTPAAQVNNSSWTYNIGATQSVAVGDTNQVTLATHQFNAESCYYDDITMTGAYTPPASVDQWNMY